MTEPDLRSPWSDAEWPAIVRALGAERARLAKLELPFPQDEQTKVVRRVVGDLRAFGQRALALEVG